MPASPRTIAFLLFPNVTQLDLTGPAQVLSRLPDAKVELVAKTLDPAPTDAGFALLPTATFETAAAPDILCVPGGFGVTDAMEDAATLAWLRGAATEAEWVTSVCTGALLLGAAGLLRASATLAESRPSSSARIMASRLQRTTSAQALSPWRTTGPNGSLAMRSGRITCSSSRRSLVRTDAR